MHTIADGRVQFRVPFRAIAVFGAAAIALSSLALARPGPEPACQALAARVGQAVVLKAKGTPIDKAVASLSARTPEDASLDGAQAAYFDRQLPGAVRFAYVAGMSADSATSYYLKQCRMGG
jgi:hypothetical protein